MSKRRFIIISLSLVPAILLAAIWTPVLLKAHTPPGIAYDCPFCRESTVEGQAVYQGTHLMVLANWTPVLPGHLMIIPRRHVVRVSELNPEELVEFGDVVGRIQEAFQRVYGSSDMLLCAQDGVKAGQTVYHMHFHAIPRPEQNVFTKLKLWYIMLVRPIGSANRMTPEQIQIEYAPLAEAMQNPT